MKIVTDGKDCCKYSYALPILIYPLTSLPNPPKETFKHIEKLIYGLIWDGKPDKYKCEILIFDYDKGGIK